MRFFQDALLVALEQRIPMPPQINLMTFQPAPRKVAFEFLDDLAVAAHRAVEALQVAVDDEDQVVSFSRAAMPMAPSDSTSSVSPSPRKAHTLRSLASMKPRLSMYFMKRAW